MRRAVADILISFLDADLPLGGGGVMANKLDAEARMTIKTLAERGHTNRAIARLLGVHENATRFVITDGVKPKVRSTAAAASRTGPRPSRRRSRTGWNRSMAVVR